ncbi:MAG: hypothetical protein A2W83_00775 [Sulfuricurvum sp. RIFCSPLOWO2_12_43_5]|nr:MAG: hypothetical protein A2W83_00775 [Sulfuricurvum sp. RIFCSPLOWO2_12_43_5]
MFIVYLFGGCCKWEFYLHQLFQLRDAITKILKEVAMKEKGGRVSPKGEDIEEKLRYCRGFRDQ